VARNNSVAVEALTTSQLFVDVRENSLINTRCLKEGMPVLGSYKPETAVVFPDRDNSARKTG